MTYPLRVWETPYSTEWKFEANPGSPMSAGNNFTVLPTSASGPFQNWVWPVPVWNGRKPVISQEFKPGADPTWGMVHAGVDIMFIRLANEPARQPEGIRSANPKRTGFFMPSNRIPVLAAGDGIVIASGPNWAQGFSLGHYVIIKHENGYYTFYQHLIAKGLVSKSTRVKAGTPIGFVGHGEKTPLNHLHFEIWPGGIKKRAIDPAPILAGVIKPTNSPTSSPGSSISLPGSPAESIRRSIQQGERDENRLTDLVFNARHPELQGRRIRSDERQLVQEWLSIRDSLVRPALKSFSTGAVPLTTPSKTTWVGTLLPLLNKYRGDIPLDYLLGWIAVESGGQIGSTTSLNERGYFQLHPDESKALRIDHNRLSLEPDYSIWAGIQLIRFYGNRTKALGINYGTDLFWHITKLWHWLPAGLKAIVEDMKKQGFKPSTWNDFKAYVLGNPQTLSRVIGSITSRTRRKDLPQKWHPQVGFDFVDKLYRRGQEIAARLANP